MKKFVLTFEVFDDNEHSNKEPSIFGKMINKAAYYLGYCYSKTTYFLKKICSYWKPILIVIVSFLLIASIVYAFIGNEHFVLNPKSHIFHEEWCFTIQNSKNVINFKGSRFEVIIKGYSPCSHCTP